uniref:Lysozyme n=1 Tax=uncultured prokaryote TaxID=198431 RepID=A0A0H5Q1T3_9ZZZZ|nr:hypothetical protein [uncultured prokaryote]
MKIRENVHDDRRAARELLLSANAFITTKAFEFNYEYVTLHASKRNVGGYRHFTMAPIDTIVPRALADLWLQDDLELAADQIRKRDFAPMTQGAFDALACFVFDMGASDLRQGDLCHCLELGLIAPAARILAAHAWRRSDQRTPRRKRRIAEALLMQTGRIGVASQR